MFCRIFAGGLGIVWVVCTVCGYVTDYLCWQAMEAGLKLRDLIGDESVYFMVSPYTRTRMTYNIVKETLDPKQWATKEDPRLRGKHRAQPYYTYFGVLCISLLYALLEARLHHFIRQNILSIV